MKKIFYDCGCVTVKARGIHLKRISAAGSALPALTRILTMLHCEEMTNEIKCTLDKYFRRCSSEKLHIYHHL